MSVITKLVKAVKGIPNKIGKQINGYELYDYSTKESRESTIEYLYQYAKSQRSSRDAKWREQDRYYNNDHVTQMEIYQECKENGIPWLPAVIPDPYIHVESQISTIVPDFEFKGRDDQNDSEKAKQREYVVRYVTEQNEIDKMNTENERTLGKHGNAFWKVSWNANKMYGGMYGDLEIGNPDVSNIFPDPCAVDVDDCEYIDYAYPVHKLKVARTFKRQLTKLGLSLNDLVGGSMSDTEIYDSATHDVNMDTVQVIEHWFRQPQDGKETMEVEVDGKVVKIPVEWEAGDIACSICINFIEVQYIPKYWVKTGEQNKLYPFIKYCKIPVRKAFWDKSELDTIKELVDAADRELAMGLLNDAFTANDIVILEENALSEDSEFSNSAGATIKVKQGMVNSVRRLGGLNSGSRLFEMIDKLREIIQQTVGNFDSAMGNEPTRVTTASGIAQLNERADKRKDIKKADRLTGFQRLYELIDWSALEFFDDDRMIYIGATKPDEEPIIFNYNSDTMRKMSQQVGEFYYPKVDCVINAGDGMAKSKSFTLATTENLISKPINLSNYKIVLEMLDIMDTPNKKELKAFYEELYAQDLELKTITTAQQIAQIQNPPMVPPQADNKPKGTQETLDELLGGMSPEELQAIDENPDLMETVHNIATSK